MANWQVTSDSKQELLMQAVNLKPDQMKKEHRKMSKEAYGGTKKIFLHTNHKNVSFAQEVTSATSDRSEIPL